MYNHCIVIKESLNPEKYFLIFSTAAIRNYGLFMRFLRPCEIFSILLYVSLSCVLLYFDVFCVTIALHFSSGKTTKIFQKSLQNLYFLSKKSSRPTRKTKSGGC